MTVYLGNKPVGVTKIVKKEVAKKKFGASIDDILGSVDADGRYIAPQGTIENPVVYDFSAIKVLGTEKFTYWGSGVQDRFIADFSGLETVGDSVLKYFAYVDTSIFKNNLIGVDLRNVKTIAYSGMRYFAQNQRLLTGYIDLNKVESIGGYGMYSAFHSTNITGFGFNSLKSVGSNALGSCFYGCDKIVGDVYFPELTSVDSNAFGSTLASAQTFYKCTGITGIHFRADMQATIEALTGYSNKWGATSSTIYFDL